MRFENFNSSEITDCHDEKPTPTAWQTSVDSDNWICWRCGQDVGDIWGFIWHTGICPGPDPGPSR